MEESGGPLYPVSRYSGTGLDTPRGLFEIYVEVGQSQSVRLAGSTLPAYRESIDGYRMTDEWAGAGLARASGGLSFLFLGGIRVGLPSGGMVMSDACDATHGRHLLVRLGWRVVTLWLRSSSSVNST